MGGVRTQTHSYTKWLNGTEELFDTANDPLELKNLANDPQYKVDLEKMRITSEISESFLNQVSVGEMVDLKFSSSPDETFKVPISRIGTVIDPITRTFTAEVLMDSDNLFLT